MDGENVPLGWWDQFWLTSSGQWISQYKFFVISALAILCCLAITAMVALGRSPGLTQAKRVQESYSQWKENPTDAGCLEKLEQGLRSFPALSASLRGEIAQILLSNGMLDDALRVGQKSLGMLKEISPLHGDYAETSLEIGKGEIQGALEGSVTLKEKLKKDHREATPLYANNLIRIAFLQQKLGNRAGENAAWLEWSQFSETDRAASMLALKGLGDEKLPFSAYLESRN